MKLRRRRQAEIQRSALLGAALRPDSATMAKDDPADDGQADAGTGKFGFRMQALEHAEQLVSIVHVKSHSVVADKVDLLRALLVRPDFDPRRIARSGEFECIGQNVGQHMLEQRPIAVAIRQFTDLRCRGRSGH